MRFEPRIVRPSEPPELTAAAGWTDEEFEARLPGELELLGGQLRDDAARLAAVYPADGLDGSGDPSYKMDGSGDPSYGSVGKSRRTALVAWSAAGTLASVLLVAVVSLPWFFANGGNRSGGIAGENAKHNPPQGEPKVNRLVQSTPEKSDWHEPVYPAAALPALFLQNVSGPELEGLFDLWEADAAEQNRISI